MRGKWDRFLRADGHGNCEWHGAAGCNLLHLKRDLRGGNRGTGSRSSCSSREGGLQESERRERGPWNLPGVSRSDQNRPCAQCCPLLAHLGGSRPSCMAGRGHRKDGGGKVRRGDSTGRACNRHCVENERESECEGPAAQQSEGRRDEVGSLGVGSKRRREGSNVRVGLGVQISHCGAITQ